MYISCSTGRDDINLEFLFVPFPFSGDIGKPSSAGYDMKVQEYTEFLRNSSGKYNLSARCIERNFPTKCSRSFWPIRSWVPGIYNRVSNPWRFLSRRVTVSASVSRVHPRTSLAQVQSPSPAMFFLKLAKSLESPGKNSKIHLRAQNVPSKTRGW